MRVFLLGSLAFEGWDQGAQECDFGGIEDPGGLEIVAGFVAPLHELHDFRGRDKRCGGQSFERIAIGQQAFFEIDALRLQGAEQLLDAPATAIEIDHVSGIGK